MTYIGEASLIRLSEAYARHVARVSVDTSRPSSGRHFPAYVLTNHELAVAEIVSVTEHFSTGRLQELQPTISDRDLSSWFARNRVWRETEQIDVEDQTQFPDWPVVLGFVEARNAIQHGLGSLTRRQLSPRYRASVLNALVAAQVRLSGSRIVLTDQAVATCFRHCSAFVLSMDIRARTP